MASKVIKQWLDELESALERDAKRAGLLRQSTSVGTAREFLIQRVLRSFLPSCVRIGTGMVFDSAQDRFSKQIDIILFDSRTPAFEIGQGLGLYPVEGVLATIEVKSSMNKSTLSEALTNCHSILELSANILPDVELEGVARIIADRDGRSPENALETARFDLKPTTYIFAFQSAMSLKNFRETIQSWFSGAEYPNDFAGTCPRLPRVIVGGENLGVLADPWIQLQPSDEIQRADIRKQIGDGARPLMATVRSEHRFGWLACHLLHTLSRRLVLPHGRMPIRFSTESHLPIEWYADEMKSLDSGELIWWKTK